MKTLRVQRRRVEPCERLHVVRPTKRETRRVSPIVHEQSSFIYTTFTQTTDGPYRAQQDHDGKTGRDGPNEDIAQAIEELAKLYRDALHKNKFQRESYQKVANIVRSEC